MVLIFIGIHKMILCFAMGDLMLNQINVDKSENIICTTEIAIGSTNPVKIQAVRNALIDEKMHVVSCAGSSNVRSQPLSDEETLQGAINRAKNCLEKTDSTLAIGLEAGVVFLQDNLYLCHWGAIVDRHQNIYFTNGPLILLPLEYWKLLQEGQSLEDIMHHSTGIENLGTKSGAIGIFTNNKLNREEVMTQIAKILLGQYQYYQSAIK